MRRLCVKLDRIAGLRQMRDSLDPDPVAAASVCEINGADRISVRLKTRQNSIQPRDIRLLSQLVQTSLNLEMPNRQDFLALAEKYQPDYITIIPAYHGSGVIQNGLKINPNLKDTVNDLRQKGFNVCLLLDPDPQQIKQALRLDLQAIEICTGNYALLSDKTEINKEIKNIARSAELVNQANLLCAAGHGINYRNIRYLADISEIEEFRIGYALVARAIFTGLNQAVRDLRTLID